MTAKGSKGGGNWTQDAGKNVVCKICRVGDRKTARQVVWLGADMVGLHAIQGMDDTRAIAFRAICDQARQDGGPATALLTKLTDPDAVVAMVRAVEPTHLQLHTKWAEPELERLQAGLSAAGLAGTQLIVVIDASDTDAPCYVAFAKRFADLLLFDHWEGGTGRLQNPAALKAVLALASPLPALVAGGLTPDNVRDIVSKLKPYGVDVQSSVQDPHVKGKKDLRKVARFVREARGLSNVAGLHVLVPQTSRLVSMSLTDVPADTLEAAVRRFEELVDVFHLDHSNGAMAPGFIADHVETAKRLLALSPTSIYDIHAFAGSDNIESIADIYLAANDMLRVVFMHIDLDEAAVPSKKRLKSLAAALEARGVSLGIALQAPREASERLEVLLKLLAATGIRELSIVGPGDPSKYQARMGPVLRAVRGWRGASHYGVGIDRAVTLEKARFAGLLGASRAVLGATSLSDPTVDAAQYVALVRSTLAGGNR